MKQRLETLEELSAKLRRHNRNRAVSSAPTKRKRSIGSVLLGAGRQEICSRNAAPVRKGRRHDVLCAADLCIVQRPVMVDIGLLEPVGAAT